jgi:ankyrin repeat protein
MTYPPISARQQPNNSTCFRAPMTQSCIAGFFALVLLTKAIAIGDPAQIGSDLAKDFEDLVKAGDVSKVDAWLKAHPAAIDADFESGGSALCTICEYGKVEMMDAYRSAGGSLKWQSRTEFHDPPLIALVQRQKDADQIIKMADRLKEAGADINTENATAANASWNCLGCFYVANLNFKPGLSDPRDRLRVVDHLLKLGADINGGALETVLHLAARNGDAAMVEALIKRGADVNRATKRGLPFVDPNHSPLRVALEELNKTEDAGYRAGLQQVIDLLKEHGGH